MCTLDGTSFFKLKLKILMHALANANQMNAQKIAAAAHSKQSQQLTLI